MDKKVLSTVIQLRRGTEVQWEAIKNEFVPAAGEPCVTLDGVNAGQIKIGNGIDSWGALKYSGVGGLDVTKIYGDTVDSSKATIDGVTYTTTSDAIAAVVNNATVKMSGGLSKGESLNIDKNITLDMNSAVIVDDEKCPMKVDTSGELTLTGNGSVECNKNTEPAINNCGKMTIENGNYTRTVDEKNDTFYTILNHGEITINDGVFQAPGNVSSMIENGYWDYNSTDPKYGHVDGQNAEICILTINGGTFISAFYIIKNDDNGIVNINGGKFYGTIFHNGTEMTINDGYFEVSDGTYNIGLRKLNDNMNAGKTVINGGIYVSNGESNFKINDGEPEVIIKGGKFNKKVPATFIAEGYEQNLVDGYYVVTKTM